MLPETSQPGNELDDIKLMQRDAQHKELIATLEALTMATMKDKKTELKGAELVTIKGEKGEKGDKGDKGDSITGPQGPKGDKGDSGQSGKDGKTPVAGVDFPLPKDGNPGRDGKDGKPGKTGPQGSPDTAEQIRDKLKGLKKGQRLHFDDLDGTEWANNLQLARHSSHATGRLQDLVDVLITAEPSDGQVLAWDATAKDWKPETVAGGGGTWGSITGTLSNQTDLQTALDGKVDENTAITGATKTKVTYDEKGLVTAGADATTADIADSTNKRYVTDAQLTVLGNTSGTNTGDQTSIVGITGTKAQFDTAVTDGNFLYVGDITQYTDEMAQDAVGNAVGNGLDYDDTTGAISVDETELAVPAANVIMPTDGGSPTLNTLAEDFTTKGSSGVADGTITYVTVGTSATKISVASGEGYIRTTNDQQGELKFCKWAASPDLYTFSAPTAGFENVIFIGIEYSGGTVSAVAKTAFTDWNWYTNFPLARCSYDGTTMRILNAYAHAEDTVNLIRKYLRLTMPFTREEAPEGSGGLELSVALRALAMTAGKVWHGFNNYSLGAVASGSAFDTHYKKAGGGFNTTTGVTAYPNTQYDNGSGTLQDLGTNKYGTLWVYLDVSDGSLDVMYGAVNATSVALAQADTIPTTPDHLRYHGRLIGRIIFKKGDPSPALVESAWTSAFGASAVGDHALLTNLQGGTAGEYYHLTSAEYTGTGTNNFVRQTTPTLTTPILGVATATSINKVAITAPATAATLTIADGQTLTVNGSATITNGTHSGTNTGDQTSIVGITGTKAQFDTAVTDGNFLYVGDITQYTDEMAQDAIGAMIDSTLVYTDSTPLLTRAALTGDVTAAQGSNATTIANDAVTFAKMQNIATGRLLGRSSASTGDVEELSVGTGLSLAGGTLSATGVPGGSGDVVGPASSTNNDIALFDGTTGKLIKDSGKALSAYFEKAVDDTDDITEGVTNKFNVTHTGDVTGATALTLDKTAITGKSAVTAVGTDYVLISDTSDSGNLKKALASDFMVGGSGITRTIVVTSGSATMGSSASTDYIYHVTGAHTMSLPAAAGNTNVYTVKNKHSANITVDTAGAETIEGAASISISPDSAVDIYSDGTNWNIK